MLQIAWVTVSACIGSGWATDGKILMSVLSADRVVLVSLSVTVCSVSGTAALGRARHRVENAAASVCSDEAAVCAVTYFAQVPGEAHRSAEILRTSTSPAARLLDQIGAARFDHSVSQSSRWNPAG